MTYKQETIDITGKRTLLVRGGSGEPVLYLHGLLGDIHTVPLDTSLPPFLDALAKRFTLFSPAHPGFSQSQGLEQIGSMEDMVFHYLDLLDQLKLEKATIVGFSFGGWIAAELAVRYPHRVDKLVLIDALGLRVEGARIGDFFQAVTPRLYAGRKQVRELLFHDPESELALSLLPDAMSPDRLLLYFQSQVCPARIGWSPPYLHSLKLASRLWRIKAPTLVLWGDSDRLASSKHAEAYHQGISGSQLVMIEKGGHNVPLEQPEKVAKAVMGFLAKK